MCRISSPLSETPAIKALRSIAGRYLTVPPHDATAEQWREAVSKLPPQRIVAGVNDQPEVVALLKATCGTVGQEG